MKECRSPSRPAQTPSRSPAELPRRTRTRGTCTVDQSATLRAYPVLLTFGGPACAGVVGCAYGNVERSRYLRDNSRMATRSQTLPTDPGDGYVRLHRGSSARGGKPGTLVVGLPGSDSDLDANAEALQTAFRHRGHTSGPSPRDPGRPSKAHNVAPRGGRTPGETRGRLSGRPGERSSSLFAPNGALRQKGADGARRGGARAAAARPRVSAVASRSGRGPRARAPLVVSYTRSSDPKYVVCNSSHRPRMTRCT